MQNEVGLIQQAPPMQEFAGWKVIVVGGSRGIGRAVTLGFAMRGASVSTCARTQEALDILEDEVARLGHMLHIARCDVGEANAVSDFVRAAAQTLGGVDVIVNCASALAPGNDDASWSASINVDLMGSVWATEAAMPYLKSSAHPSVVNIASVAALKAVPSRIAHGAIKAAVMHQTASSALAVAPYGIRVNCVVPGSTQALGGIWDRIAHDDPGLYEATRKSIPLGRFAKPDDIAKAVIFLASSDAGWITGQNIVVDGGQSLVRPGI